ncbi:MAG: replication initiation protein [Saprospiraceae bacterium]
MRKVPAMRCDSAPGFFQKNTHEHMKPSKKTKPTRRNAGEPSAIVVSSNDLAHAKYSMTLWQKRLFAFAVSRLRREDREFSWQRIYYSELINYFEAGGGKKAYDAIREAPRQLDMTIEVPYRDEHGHLRYAFLKILSGYTIPAEEGERNQYVDLKFNDDLRPHLLALKERFMGYDLTNVKRLRSVYSIRIYELLKSHQFQGRVEFSVSYLRSILQLEDSYRLYADFRRNVIDKARSDMREACDIEFDYEEIKKSNRVESLMFVIRENTDFNARTAAEAKPLETPSHDGAGEGGVPANPALAAPDGVYAELESLVVHSWGVSPARFAQLLEEHPADDIRRAVRVTKRKAATGEVGNKAGFFVSAIQKGFTDEAEAREQKKQKTAETARRLAALEQESAAVSEAFRREVFSIIRQLTEADETVAARAIDALRASAHPLIRSKIAGLGPTPKVDDFRHDEYLREKVIDEIIRQHPAQFEAAYADFQAQQRRITDEMARVRGA